MMSDPFEMALVHSAFRRELNSAVDLARNTTVGDTDRSAVVGRHITFMLTAIHHHHLAEDTQIWPRLSAVAPSRTEEIRRMRDDHRGISEASDRVIAATARWTDSVDGPTADQLIGEIEEFIRLITEHFDVEERHVVPLIADYLTPRQWRRFLAHGSAFLRAHPKRGLALGGMVLDGQSLEDRRRFLGNVPLPVRT